jgi:hypothetical protein
VAISVLDRPCEGLDDSGLPPLPPAVEWGEGPSGHGPPAETHLLRLIVWSILLVMALPAAYGIEVLISHAS